MLSWDIWFSPSLSAPFTSSPTVSTIPFKSKSPPARNYGCIHLLFFAYVLLISAHVHAIAQEHLPLHSLCTIPFILSCGSLVLYFHQCRQLEPLIIYFPPTHAVNLFNIAIHVAVLISHLHLTIHVMVPFFPHLLIKKIRHVERLENCDYQGFHRHGFCSWQQSHLH